MNFGGMGGGPKSPIKQPDLKEDLRAENTPEQGKEIQMVLPDGTYISGKSNTTMRRAVERVCEQNNGKLPKPNILDIIKKTCVYWAPDQMTANPNNNPYEGFYPYSGFSGAKFSLFYLLKNAQFVKSFNAGEGVYISTRDTDNFYFDGGNFEDGSSVDDMTEYFAMINTLDGRSMPIPVFYEIFGLQSPFEQLEKTSPDLFNSQPTPTNNEGRTLIPTREYEKILKSMIGDRFVGIENREFRKPDPRLSNSPKITPKELNLINNFIKYFGDDKTSEPKIYGDKNSPDLIDEQIRNTANERERLKIRQIEEMFTQYETREKEELNLGTEQAKATLEELKKNPDLDLDKDRKYLI